MLINYEIMKLPIFQASKLSFLIVIFSTFSFLNFNSIEVAFSQNEKLDALNTLLKNAPHDTVRLRILNKIVKTEKDPKLNIGYDDQIETIAKRNLNANPSASIKNTCLKYLANVIFRNGNRCYIQGDYTKAMEYYNKSLKIREELGDKNEISNSLNNIGNIYYNQCDIPKALEYYNKSFKHRVVGIRI